MSDDGFYHAFEAAFRGSREEIRIRLKAYRPYLDPLIASDLLPRSALDLGCGRGEWLELLGDLGFAARGVDLDDAMLDDARALGLTVDRQGALEALQASADGSLGLVSAFHLIEHLEFGDLLDLVAQAKRALAPGGLLILETPNPENIDVATVTFHNDPTHKAPMPPNVLRFLAEHTGFAQVCLRRLNERPLVAGGTITLEDVFTQVSPDYAIVAQTEGPAALRDPLRPLLARQQGLKRHDLAHRFEERWAHRADVTDLELALNRELHHVRHAHNTLASQHRSLSERFETLSRTHEALATDHGALHRQHTEISKENAALADRLDRLTEEFRSQLVQVDEALAGLHKPSLRERIATWRDGVESAPPRANASPVTAPATDVRDGTIDARSQDAPPQQGGGIAPVPAVPQEQAPAPAAAEGASSNPTDKAKVVTSQEEQSDVAPMAPMAAIVDRAAAGPLPASLSWRMEGPFDSSYSLAIVNRALARALAAHGVDVALVSAEGPGAFDPDPGFLAANPDLKAMWEKDGQGATVVSRNMYPPRVSDVGPGFAGVHNYAWEETGFPDSYAAAFNDHLGFLTVPSEHVKKVMIDNGVAVPVHVTGNGVDHLDQIVYDPLPEGAVPRAGRTFLHVSSCFPRKGADALLAAWGEAFDRSDDVLLVIKTFDNPHNDISARVEAMQAEHPEMAPVTVICEDWSAGQMRSLYRHADVVVLPSRAEGFCLPVAEALLEGCPVLATGWSGVRAFDGCPMVRFIDYALSPADSHLGADQSLWAEPDHDDLVRGLRTLATEALPDAAQRQSAREWLMQHMRWEDVASRSVAAVRHAAQTEVRWPKVGWVSTFNSRCGIATYSAHLINHLGGAVQVLAPDVAHTVVPDAKLAVAVHRCWTDDARDPLLRLYDKIESLDLETVVVQFNYAFFDFESLGRLIHRLVDAGRQVVLMMHGTDDSRAPSDRQIADIRDALARCARLLVHHRGDIERLKAIGLEHNVTLFPHGCLPMHPDAGRAAAPLQKPTVWLGSYGFLLANKGLPELIETVSLLRERGHDVRLKMMNALYPKEESRRLREQCAKMILRRGLAPFVRLETAFRPDEDAIAALSTCDLVVFPYQHSAESASGAVRYGLTAGRPVVVTPLRIFDEFSDITLSLPGIRPSDMADGLEAHIAELRSGETFKTMHSEARAQCAALSYTRLGPRLHNMIVGLAVSGTTDRAP